MPERTLAADRGALSLSGGAEETITDTRSTPAVRIPIQRGAMLGRYVVLERLGAGAMGVVYAALDPDLDRKVALKVLHADADSDRPWAASGSGGNRRVIREAQALARLNHPNVVTVHDVGEHDGRIYLAMELVAGTTLTEWARTRRAWTQALDVLMKAGQGLAAAHLQGLVHRDFKPDNVMVGNDGRVRVMDFGLARASHIPPTEPGAVTAPLGTEATGLVGTPAYMAPEQLRALPVDARTDQFAFCVTAWEILFGERPFSGDTLASIVLNVCEGKLREPPAGVRVPTALKDALARGLAVDPQARFESMTALLHRLARVRNGMLRRRRHLGLAAVASIALGIVAWRDLDARARAAACDRVAAEVATTWPARREAVRAGLRATGLPFADPTLEKLQPWLDRWADSWRDVRRDVCLLREDEARALACLALQRAHVEGTLDPLETGDAAVVIDAVARIAGIAPASECLDPSRLSRIAWPDATQWDRVLETRRRSLGIADAAEAEQDGVAIDVAQQLLSEAEAIGFAPLVTEMRLVLGDGLRRDDPVQAEEILRAAYFDAIALDLPVIAAESALLLEHLVVTRGGRMGNSLEWSRHAAGWIARLGETDDLLGARHALIEGGTYRLLGDYETAQSMIERALALHESLLGPDHPQTATALHSLGIVLAQKSDDDGALDAFERALTIRESVLGADHPHVWHTWAAIANVLRVRDEVDEAERINEWILARREAAFGPYHRDVAATLNNLANARNGRGDYEGALELHERSLQIRQQLHGPDHVDVALSLTNIANAHHDAGRFEQAVSNTEQALAVRQRVLGPDHPDVATSVHNLAVMLIDVGRIEDAKAAFARALAIRRTVFGDEHRLTDLTRRSLEDLESWTR